MCCAGSPTPRSDRACIGAIASSAISSSQNRRASSRADSVAKRRSRINSGSAALRSVSQCVSTRSTMRRRSRAAPPTRVDKADLVADFERDPERGEGRFRQAGADQQRLQAGAAAVVQQRGDAGLRQAGQFRQRRIEQFEIARQQRAQDQAGGELAGGAQMPHQAAHVLAARARRDVDGGALARLARDAALPGRRSASCGRRRIAPACRRVWRPAPARVAAGRSSSTSIDSRIAARWP